MRSMKMLKSGYPTIYVVISSLPAVLSLGVSFYVDFMYEHECCSDHKQ